MNNSPTSEEMDTYIQCLTKEDKPAASVLWNALFTNSVADTEGNIYVFSDRYSQLSQSDKREVVKGPHSTSIDPSDLPRIIETHERRFVVFHPEDTPKTKSR